MGGWGGGSSGDGGTRQAMHKAAGHMARIHLRPAVCVRACQGWAGGQGKAGERGCQGWRRAWEARGTRWPKGRRPPGHEAGGQAGTEARGGAWLVVAGARPAEGCACHFQHRPPRQSTRSQAGRQAWTPLPRPQTSTPPPHMHPPCCTAPRSEQPAAHPKTSSACMPPPAVGPHLAEVSEVVLPHKVRRGRPHRRHVQPRSSGAAAICSCCCTRLLLLLLPVLVGPLLLLHNEVLVFPKFGAEPAHTTQHRASKLIAPLQESPFMPGAPTSG